MSVRGGSVENGLVCYYKNTETDQLGNLDIDSEAKNGSVVELNPSTLKSEQGNVMNHKGSGSRFVTCILGSTLNDPLYNILIYLILPVLLWLVSFLFTESQSLPPNGQIFILLVLEFGGRILGHGAVFIKIPPMVGMLGVGLLIRNVPYIDFGKNLNPELSSYVRQIALAVILVRAGLGLDLSTLIKMKALVFRLAIFPTVLEATVVAIVAHFLLDFPWAWAFVLGFVEAPVSPAVVVPRLLALREQGYGVDKGVPTFIIASAALDNIVAISLFGVSLGFALSQGSTVMSIFQGPLEILMGLAGGLAYGVFIGLIFHSAHKNDKNAIAVRALLTFLGGLFFLLGFRYFNYSGAGALSCLTLAFTAECLWKSRGVVGNRDPDILCWIFYLLWNVFEPLLFGAIGCAIDLLTLDARVVGLGLICIAVGGVIRFGVTFVMASRVNLTVKEKLFCSISYTPKATVQAAIGPVALEQIRKIGTGELDEKLGLQILTIAALTILLTAPLGELGVMLSGSRFLSRNNQHGT